MRGLFGLQLLVRAERCEQDRSSVSSCQNGGSFGPKSMKSLELSLLRQTQNSLVKKALPGANNMHHQQALWCLTTLTFLAHVVTRASKPARV